ncbi:flagellar hook-basal body complex protein FliE [Azospirillum rugosum]|uniref:Flagellar hook-basal body complex protein FliE n=1 Tax=Azospirillum rugosum TaxID=416170 RepID=A0ABS4SNA1_9PROT|nr:flagellar hook-basal body complex protein FliE [Azospirillum rugosum]MBP2293558.1 flagellar hook-basal body complex protein FliE [Azospirillum rugosum]MDQ0529237.1 flagellar hook-basal body complex protein FliE [Azospirillum rugosum]
MVNPINAAAAYANTAARTNGPGLAPRDGASFGDVLEQTAKDAIGTMKNSEKMSAMAAVGQADLTDVVQAVTNAEITLQTVTTVRDKVLNAYQEILRMPI